MFLVYQALEKKWCDNQFFRQQQRVHGSPYSACPRGPPSYIGVILLLPEKTCIGRSLCFHHELRTIPPDLDWIGRKRLGWDRTLCLCAFERRRLFSIRAVYDRALDPIIFDNTTPSPVHIFALAVFGFHTHTRYKNQKFAFAVMSSFLVLICALSTFSFSLYRGGVRVAVRGVYRLCSQWERVSFVFMYALH